jgi:NAD+ kinase
LFSKPPAHCTIADDAGIAQTNFVIVFGGDGTLLGAARSVAPYGTPLLSVHLGHFGFVTEVAPEHLRGAVERAIQGQCPVQERLMLQATLQAETLYGLNDMVVASRAVRMAHIRTEIGEQLLTTYAADGVIVATPTGSTGYSLSAGGPLIHPTAPVLVVTPIAPHTLSARTLVIPDTETVRLTVENDNADIVLSVDGQLERPMHKGDSVVVQRAPFTARLLTADGMSFYQKIRSRWHFGERVLPHHSP